MADDQPHVVELLPDLILGALEAATAAEVEAHLLACPACTRERAALTDLLGEVAYAVPAIPGQAEDRQRLLDAASAPAVEGGRLGPFVARVAALLDIAAERAGALLDLLDAPEAPWARGQLPGEPAIDLLTPPSGPARAGALVCVLRIPPGARYPGHRHRGAEQVLILQGGFFDESEGREYGPGELRQMAAGSRHAFRGLPGPACICLGVVEGGIEFDEPAAGERRQRN